MSKNILLKTFVTNSLVSDTLVSLAALAGILLALINSVISSFLVFLTIFLLNTVVFSLNRRLILQLLAEKDNTSKLETLMGILDISSRIGLAGGYILLSIQMI